MNEAYSSAVAITISVLIIGLFVFNYVQSPPESSSKKLIKVGDQVINVPHHVLDAILSKYRNRLILHSKLGGELDADALLAAEKSLTEHVRTKYGIELSEHPMELEKYVLNQGVPQSSIYDDELVGGQDLSATGRSLGTIVWLLEQIIIQNRTHSGTIEIPLVLEKIEVILAATPTKPNPQLPWPSCDAATPASTCNVPPVVVDVLDSREQWRRPTKASPKFCSALLRNNLGDYLSDSAAQDLYSDGAECALKSKNTREASAGWQSSLLNRMSATSHTCENEFDETDTRIGANVAYAGYELPLRMMKQDMANRAAPNQKQALTDSWDFLEQEFLS